jgi:hypothetical protein
VPEGNRKRRRFFSETAWLVVIAKKQEFHGAAKDAEQLEGSGGLPFNKHTKPGAMAAGEPQQLLM